jgi:hypothetical protein
MADFGSGFAPQIAYLPLRLVALGFWLLGSLPLTRRIPVIPVALHPGRGV